MAKGKLLLKGISGSKGEYAGHVWVVKTMDPVAYKDFPKGHILVSPKLFPEHNDAIGRAAAIIMDTGGKSAHGNIVAREQGIPAVSRTEMATDVLKTGMKVVVDGNSGEVYEYIEGISGAPSAFEKLAKERGLSLNPQVLERLRQIQKK